MVGKALWLHWNFPCRVATDAATPAPGPAKAHRATRVNYCAGLLIDEGELWLSLYIIRFSSSVPDGGDFPETQKSEDFSPLVLLTAPTDSSPVWIPGGSTLLIFRRLIDVIDTQHLHRSLVPLNLQSKLLVQCRRSPLPKGVIGSNLKFPYSNPDKST